MQLINLHVIGGRWRVQVLSVAVLGILYLAVRNLEAYRGRNVRTRSSGWKQALQALTTRGVATVRLTPATRFRTHIGGRSGPQVRTRPVAGRGRLPRYSVVAELTATGVDTHFSRLGIDSKGPTSRSAATDTATVRRAANPRLPLRSGLLAGPNT